MIDPYYRIKALYELGVQIHLHCFEYGRRHSEILASFCKSVNYYPREIRISSHLSLIPYTVLSRQSNVLLENLMADNHPIFFDGLHTTHYLNHPALSGRKKFVRTHNIEHRYYMALAKNERNISKKFYYLVESIRLKLYENKLKKANIIFPISRIDQEYFSSEYKCSELLLPFIPFNKITCKLGNGEYILYHGDLSVNANDAICEFLIKEVFSKVPFPCIITGKNPSGTLRSKASHHKNITIIPDPDEKQMLEMIRDAHINVIPAKTCNGFKLKLLYALFAGRHCIVNSMMVKGTALDSLCHIADTSSLIIEKIHVLMGQSFTEEMISERTAILTETYNNAKNAGFLASFLFQE